MEGLAEIITDFFNSIGHKQTRDLTSRSRGCPLYLRKRTCAIPPRYIRLVPIAS
jgi:hypothetical protein